MVEFFKSVYDWFIINKDTIVLTLTSSNFVAFLSAILLFVKQIKTNKASNATNSALSTSLKDVSSITQKVDNTESKIDTVDEKVCTLQADTQDALNKLISKVNAILDVQSIVYSTVKDESMRKSINGILIDAKHNETNVFNDLQSEIENLKEQLNKKVEDVKDVVENAAVTVKKTIKKTKSSVDNSNVSRY